MARNLICQGHLLIVEILECNWHLILALLVEDDFERASVVVNLEASAHSFFYLVGNTSHDDDLKK